MLVLIPGAPMASGGYRPGAGRRPAAGRRASRITKPVAALTEPRDAPGMTALHYRLPTMRDPEPDPFRRDRMAIAAAPYLHPKAEEKGKKEAAKTAAETAGLGTNWGDDLRVAVN